MPRVVAGPRPCLYCEKPFSPGKLRGPALHCGACQKRVRQCGSCSRSRVLKAGRCRDCPQREHKGMRTVFAEAFLNQPERLARIKLYARRAKLGMPLFDPRGDRREPCPT